LDIEPWSTLDSALVTTRVTCSKCWWNSAKSNGEDNGNGSGSVQSEIWSNRESRKGEEDNLRDWEGKSRVVVGRTGIGEGGGRFELRSCTSWTGWKGVNWGD
jgi:hypothetical protein